MLGLSVACSVAVALSPAARASWGVGGISRLRASPDGRSGRLHFLRMDIANQNELSDSSIGNTFFTTLDGRGDDGIAPDGARQSTREC